MMSMKMMIKQLVGGIATSSILAPVMRRSLQSSINIIYYHRVGTPPSYYKSFFSGCTYERFERDLDVLQSYFQFVSLEDMLLGERVTGDKPAAALTFDDGFSLIGNGVMDLLNRRGIRATTLVITECLDNRQLMWRHKLSAVLAETPNAQALRAYNQIASANALPTASSPSEIIRVSFEMPMETKDELMDEWWARCGMQPLPAYLAAHQPYFTWEELRTWRKNGHSVGLHTATHVSCSRLAPDAVDKEIVAPARELRTALDAKVLPFSYPFGHRLPPTIAESLYRDGMIDCVLGIQGYATVGAPLHRLERANGEVELEYSVLGKPALMNARRAMGF
ncbi:MAG: hypothetical protein FJ405_04705 [Verrucomicrobia bacterium]|nr:hypothetical protein [Verrucomicrobiota bacterium]